MKEKKIIQMEERIPKLKERRKQRSNRRLIYYVSIFFSLMLLIIYFQSSFSQVQHVTVEGTNYTSRDWVINQSDLLSGVSMWNLREAETSERIIEHEAIKSVTLERVWMNSVVIFVKEYTRIAYVYEAEYFYPVLETGKLYVDAEENISPHDAPIIRGFDNEEIRREMIEELSNTPLEVRARISDILLEPTTNDSGRLTILMNDGFTVSSTLRQFSERISPYPSVVENLDPSIEGILHMRMNPYFERLYTDEEGEEIESEG